MIFNGLLLEYCILYRSTFIYGRPGSGKTALAVWLAKQLHLRYGYRVISNIYLRFGCIRNPDPEDFYHAVVLLDEAADVLDAYEFKSELIRYFKYLRHRDLILLLPSVDEVHKRLRKLVVERIFNVEAVLGLPIWVYQWWRGPKTIPPKKGIKGFFFWWVDEEVLGDYNSVHGGVDLSTEHIIASLARSLAGTHATLGKGPLTTITELEIEELFS